MKDTHEHKNHKKMITGLLAIGLTLVLACAAGLALYPTGSKARYVESEVYEGTEIYTTESGDHGDHSGWVDLNASQSDGAEGVTWSGTTCTISVGGKYYLSADLTANLKITAEATRDSDGNVTGGEVIFCLNGYCLTCAAQNTSAVTIGEGGSSAAASDVVFSLYDCGGGKGVYYYKYYNADGDIQGLSDGNVIYSESVVYNGKTFVDWDGESDEEVFHTGYDFSDSNLTAETCDGYVRGGLITGAVFTKGSSSTNYRYNGGGVTVGPGCTFKMYGGTIAGNHVMSGTYNDYIAAGVLVYDSTFDMYGGMIAGNCCGFASTTSPSGSGVGFFANNANYPVTMNMYGGEIKENYKHSGGAGICGYVSSNFTYTVNMYGGTVSENVSDGMGGGILLNSSSSGTQHVFHMYGGTVRDNVAGGNNSRNGGGVAIGGEFEMTGGAIYGNRALNASGIGGGVYCFGSTSDLRTLGGKVYIYGNHAGGKISNLDLLSGTGARYITLSSALEEGAKVGVTVYSTQTQLTVTGSSTTTYQYIEDSMQYIISDDRSYGVRMSGDGTSTSSYLELYSLTG